MLAHRKCTSQIELNIVNDSMQRFNKGAVIQQNNHLNSMTSLYVIIVTNTNRGKIGSLKKPMPELILFLV